MPTPPSCRPARRLPRQRSRVALERLQSGARRRVPEPYRLIARCRRHRLAVRREGYSADVARVALERLQSGARPRVPEPYRGVV